LLPGAAKTPGSTGSLVKNFSRLPNRLLVARYNELRDTVAIVNLNGFVRKIDENYLDFTAIISIYRTRRVENRDTLLGG
jgi:hypothetical protein